MAMNNEGVQKEIHISKKRIFLLKIKRRIFRHVWFVRGMLLGFVILILFFGLYSITRLFNKSSFKESLNIVRLFVFVPEGITKSYQGSTNILILGKGGGGHEAPDLTDSLILLSVSRNNNDIKLISLPRDIWIKELRTKLNTIYYWGNKRQEGGGIVLAKSTVEEVTGQPIHYAVVIDFKSFVDVINLMGGINVEVENSFTDEKYPIQGNESDNCSGDTEYKCRYETVRFEEGKQIMDGDRALKYVRSRYASGDEGTDFARAARQQKILYAIKDKIVSVKLLTSPSKIKALINILNKNIETDISRQNLAIIARTVFNARNNIKSYVLPEELLENPPRLAKYDNLYVLIPKNDSWQEIKSWVEGKIMQIK